MHWIARHHRFEFPAPAIVMGIVNVTPDSFSDGGQYFDAGRAVDHALEMVAEGAGLIDIGGESTRPRALPVSVDEELRRVMPVIEQVSTRVSVPISIDTMKPEVAHQALMAGASVVNDVAANRADPGMWQVAAEFQAGYVCMHMRGDPRTMQDQPHYTDVVADVDRFFGERLNRLEAAGMPREQVVLDVGIGFGKTLEHNLQLLAHMARFTKWQRPLVLGVSRKSFMGSLLGAAVSDRVPASLACACDAVAAGARIIRTHDVKATVQAIRMFEAIRDRRA